MAQTNLDRELRHLLRGTPRRDALAVLTRGQQLGIAESTLRSYLRHRGTPRLRHLANNPLWFDPLVAVAHQRVGQHPSSTARARWLLASLLSPTRVPVSSPQRLAAARAATAVIGLDVIRSINEHGMDTALLSNTRIGEVLNRTAKPTAAALELAQAAGWVALVERPHRKASRWRLGSVRGYRAKALQDRWWQALANGDTDKVADLVRAVGHPAVTHGVGYVTWVIALADETGVPAHRLLGVPPESLRPAPEPWPENLDAYAKEHGCWAMAAGAQKAAEERAKRTRNERAVYGWMHEVLRAHPVAGWSAGDTDKDAWFAAVEKALAADPLLPALQPHAAEILAGRLLEHGYPCKEARRIGAVLVGLPEPVEDAA